MFTVTREWLEKHARTAMATGGHAWTDDQMAQLGLPHPPGQGWIDRVVGTDITHEQKTRFERALKFRDARKELTGQLF